MLNVAIVGAGIGKKHLDGFAQLPNIYSVRYICDLNERRGKALAKKQPGIEFTTDIAEILANPDIDIVDICLPPHLHFSTCMDALDLGKKVICEKPIVTSLREADQLAAKAVETGGFVGPVFQYRFGLGAAQLRALIDAGLAGRAYVGTLETHWDRSASYYQIPWRGTWDGEQGGAVLGHAIHIHDLLQTLLGPVDRVFADLATRVNNIETEDCAALSIRMQSGALITSSVTLGCAENMSRMRLVFEGFTVESDHAPYALAQKGWRFVARAPTQQAEIEQVLAGVEPVISGFAGMFEAIASTLKGENAPTVTLEDGRQSLEFVTAVYDSARTGAHVSLPLGPENRLYDGWLPESATP
ncbi:MAG: Gfo/Idh/MocA family oxidoreductase [Paracoccaceae bacterium]|nr:Gfo/Idh/MocA family oxidoreductase [Paracoccaceae bacterium]